MSPRAVSPFTVDDFQGEPIGDVEGVAIGRARITKTFSGDLTGSGVVEMVTTVCASGSRAYVAMERVTGTLHEREGTFVVRHDATDADGVQTTSWAIVKDSGTGELAGISGTGDIAIAADGSHTFTLDYELPDSP